MWKVRNETKLDHQAVEELTRRAFYNLYVPGCTEHYLVHIMREHEDFIPELALVAQLDGEIIGNIMYTKARLTNKAGEKKTILTFGPVCIAPGYQRQGYGKALMEESFRRAAALGYDAIVIFGAPANYVARGFRSGRHFGICLEDGTYPAAMLGKELVPGALAGGPWVYRQSPVMDFSQEEARRYDDTLSKMERKWQPSQEEFAILSHAFLT